MILDTYLTQLKARKLAKKTVRNYEFVLKKLNNFKPLEQIDKDDLIKFFADLKAPESTVALYQVSIKKFFKDIGKPDIVSWIKPITPKETLKSDDILTTDDINRMIDATENNFFKALIAFLFETGARISEVQTLRYKDFQETDQGLIVHIPTTKTASGYRKVILPFSSQYIRNLKAYVNAKGEDKVFKGGYSHIHITLNQIAKDAGINKHVSPHKFRHAQATDLVRRGYNEAIIRKKLGWTPTSSMIARYQHLNDEDVINATLENTGKLPITAAPRTELKEAERMSLVDAAMQFSKLSEENETLKADMDSMRKDMEKIQEFIKMGGGMELLKGKAPHPQ